MGLQREWLFFSWPLSVSGTAELLFYFSVYAFSGWLLENVYSYFTAHDFYKDNFFIGPFKPMYGFAPILLLLLISPAASWLNVFFLCLLIPTAVEYLSGALLQKITGKKWWDYSHFPFQLHGHICLHFSMCWMILSVICLLWIHPALVFIYGRVSGLWAFIWPAALFYFFGELFFAVRRHTVQTLGENRS